MKIRSKPLILLTNDDGYFSAGIRKLATTLRSSANVYVVAPDRERSTHSLALTLRRPLRVSKIGVRTFASDGTPADCVYLALNSLLPGKPRLVISGMNLGGNLGRQDVSYSGTVAAAIQASYLGIPSIAVSLLPDREGKFAVSAGAEIAGMMARRVLRIPLPAGFTLNINIPPLPVKGIRITTLGQKRYEPEIIEKQDPRGESYFWIGPGNPRLIGDETSDIHAVTQGFISITPLHTDLTDYGMIGHPLMEKFRGRASKGRMPSHPLRNR
jgi:5'-nucleotidase